MNKFKNFDQTIMVFGCDGQVGKAFQASLKQHKGPIVFMGRQDCDLSHPLSVRDVLCQYQPKIVINAAAYTSVDQAENMSQYEDVFAINEKSPTVMAEYIANIPSGIFVHYSTDYVFSGAKLTPYDEADSCGPCNELCVYGESKLAAEKAIQAIFANRISPKCLDVATLNLQPRLSRYYILRTSWVYGDGRNFIHTIIDKINKNHQIDVVADQIGVPTSAQWLAESTLELLEAELDAGIYHVVPHGETSWHGLASFIIEVARNYPEYQGIDLAAILAMASSEPYTRAKRPYNSRLSNKKFNMAMSGQSHSYDCPPWQSHVVDYVNTLLISRKKLHLPAQ